MSRRWMRRLAACALIAALLPTAGSAEELSPACTDYKRNSIVIDGYVNSPVQLSIEQLAALPQHSLEIHFVDRFGNTQTHTESGPLLWTVINDAAGGIHTPPPALEQYQGPNPWVALYVILVATNGYQSLVSEAEIDPGYGNQPVVLSIVEDGKPMADAPYSTTNKAPAQLVVPGDYKGGRYANRICRIAVMNGALGPDLNPPKRAN